MLAAKMRPCSSAAVWEMNTWRRSSAGGLCDWVAAILPVCKRQRSICQPLVQFRHRSRPVCPRVQGGFAGTRGFRGHPHSCHGRLPRVGPEPRTWALVCTRQAQNACAACLAQELTKAQAVTTRHVTSWLVSSRLVGGVATDGVICWRVTCMYNKQSAFPGGRWQVQLRSSSGAACVQLSAVVLPSPFAQRQSPMSSLVTPVGWLMLAPILAVWGLLQIAQVSGTKRVPGRIGVERTCSGSSMKDYARCCRLQHSHNE